MGRPRDKKRYSIRSRWGPMKGTRFELYMKSEGYVGVFATHKEAKQRGEELESQELGELW